MSRDDLPSAFEWVWNPETRRHEVTPESYRLWRFGTWNPETQRYEIEGEESE